MKGFAKNKDQKKHRSPWMLFILFLVLVLLTISLFKMLHKNKQTREIRDTYQSELDDLRQQEALLEQDLEYFATERGLEEEIRDRFPVVREGEELIVIIDEEPNAEIADEERTGFWKRLWR